MVDVWCAERKGKRGEYKYTCDGCSTKDARYRSHSLTQFYTLFNLIKVTQEKIVSRLLAAAGRPNIYIHRADAVKWTTEYTILLCVHKSAHTHTLNQPNSFTIDTHNIKWCLVNETGLMTAHLTCAIFHNSRETHKRLIEIHGKNFIKKCKYFRAKVMLCIVQMTFQVVLSVFQNFFFLRPYGWCARL